MRCTALAGPGSRAKPAAGAPTSPPPPAPPHSPPPTPGRCAVGGLGGSAFSFFLWTVPLLHGRRAGVRPAGLRVLSLSVPLHASSVASSRKPRSLRRRIPSLQGGLRSIPTRASRDASLKTHAEASSPVLPRDRDAACVSDTHASGSQMSGFLPMRAFASAPLAHHRSFEMRSLRSFKSVEGVFLPLQC